MNLQAIKTKLKERPIYIVLIVLPLLICCAVGLGGVLLATRQPGSTTPEPVPPVSTLPQVPIPEPLPVDPPPPPPPPSNLPAGWTMNTSSLCNVRVPVPPKAEPYYTAGTPSSVEYGGMMSYDAADVTGKYWELTENLSQFTLFNYFTDNVTVLFKHPPEIADNYLGTDNPEGHASVSVYCARNTGDYTAAELAQNIIDYETSQQYIVPTLGDNFTKWGQEVQVLVQEGFGTTNYHITTNEDYIYAIVYFSQISADAVKDGAAKIIFDEIEFL